jgi:PAS domain S-box-containing protein
MREGKDGSLAERKKGAALADRFEETDVLSARLLHGAGGPARSYMPRHLNEVKPRHRPEADRAGAPTKKSDVTRDHLEAALADANVYIFFQDPDLRYIWAFGPNAKQLAESLVGRTDEELLPTREREAVVAIKRGVLETGVPADCEVPYAMPEGRALFAVHIHPSFGPRQEIVGLTTTAFDISRVRALESEQRRLSGELAGTLQRYETALRGSNVTVYTQDRELRYTSISNPMFGRAIDQIIGRTDEEVLPPESRSAVIALKRAALETGCPQDSEVNIRQGASERWHDLHIEPLRDIGGAIVGLSCAAVDITERKEGESHLRLLMRELTHRSKNLLAVIQAMARQTARHVGSIDGFLTQFGARLQALATSHDLLVQESWYGVPLSELVRSQLGHYLDRVGAKVSLDGPNVVLKPEAAQSLGLALHELATNAAKYGALSVPAGRVAITWHRLPGSEGSGVEVLWVEQQGPKVAIPAVRGFGTMVIEQNLTRSLDAEVELTFSPEGLRCRIVLPVTQLSVGR